METEEGERVLTEKLELRIIEIPKANRILEKEREIEIAKKLKSKKLKIKDIIEITGLTKEEIEKL